MSRGRAWAIGCDGCGRRKLHYKWTMNFRVWFPGCIVLSIFSFFYADYGEEVIEMKFLKPMDEPVDWKRDSKFFFRCSFGCADH